MTEREKFIKIHELYLENSDLLVQNFFDTDSRKDLDFKIEVLTRLNNGETPGDIGDEDYYRILELYPGDDFNWDL